MRNSLSSALRSLRALRFKDLEFLVHPLFFALAPSLFILSHNLESSILRDFWEPTLLVMSAALLSTLVLWPLLQDRRQAAFLVSVYLVLFFSFGQIYDQLGGRKLLFLDFGDPRTLGDLSGIFFLAVFATSFFLKKWLPGITRFLNIMVLAWVGLSVINIASYELGLVKRGRPAGFADAPEIVKLKRPANPPDIYHIIFDTYCRQDVLKEMYDYDNGWFIDALRAMGFYVVPQATSNYVFSQLSIGSMLDLDYLKELPSGTMDEKQGKAALHDICQKNRVFPSMKAIGYKTVAFAGPAAATNFRFADMFLDRSGGKSEFYKGLLEVTPLRWASADKEPTIFSISSAGRKRLSYNLEKVPEVSRIDGPTFTFVHFVPPHTPFLWGKNGESIFVNEARLPGSYDRLPMYVPLFRDTVHYISGKILELVQEILRRSKEPPIIILHGDHGPDFGVNYKNPSVRDVKERHSILLALYLPGNGKPEPYSSMSLVNTYRLIFDRYFGADLPFLEDRNYFCSQVVLTDFKDVTDMVKSAWPDKKS